MSPFSRDELVAVADSTNAALAAARRNDPAGWGHLAAIRAEHQRAGRGRAGRTWETPPGEAVTASVLLVPGGPVRPEWASLTAVAALAVVEVLRARGFDAAIKWPNDLVLRPRAGSSTPDAVASPPVRGVPDAVASPAVRGVPDAVASPAVARVAPALVPGWGRVRKVGGILAEIVPSPAEAAEASDAVVIGIGLNVSQRALPVPWATSLVLARESEADPCAPLAVPGPLTPAALWSEFGRELVRLLGLWRVGGFEALRARVTDCCDTLGRTVRITGTTPILGVAEGLDGDGRLLVRTREGGVVTVAAGDVEHLREAEEAGSVAFERE